MPTLPLSEGDVGKRSTEEVSISEAPHLATLVMMSRQIGHKQSATATE
jgi:hypothetical protein